MPPPRSGQVAAAGLLMRADGLVALSVAVRDRVRSGDPAPGPIRAGTRHLARRRGAGSLVSHPGCDYWKCAGLDCEGPAYGDVDRDGTIGGEVDAGLLPGLAVRLDSLRPNPTPALSPMCSVGIFQMPRPGGRPWTAPLQTGERTIIRSPRYSATLNGLSDGQRSPYSAPISLKRRTMPVTLSCTPTRRALPSPGAKASD